MDATGLRAARDAEVATLQEAQGAKRVEAV
jgi:hypothetical protein